VSVHNTYPTSENPPLDNRFDVEERRSPRRSTLADVVVLEGPRLSETSVASNLSTAGAFIHTEERVDIGERLRLSLKLPSQRTPIEVAARVARSTPLGIGVRFEEISARDRSRLMSHTGFAEMDDNIVRLQERLGDLIPGNLLPLADPKEISALLEGAAGRTSEARILTQARGFSPATAFITSVGEHNDPVTGEPAISLTVLGETVPARTVVHVVFDDGPLHYAFESLVLDVVDRERADTLVLSTPPRLYLNERRTHTRAAPSQAFCEFFSPNQETTTIRVPVLDVADNGVSVEVPRDSLLLIGSRLPSFVLSSSEGLREIDGATVRYVQPTAAGTLRAGLIFESALSARPTFDQIQRRSVKSSLFAKVRRAVSFAGAKLSGNLPRRARGRQEPVEVVRYRNKLGHTVAAIIDANFDTSDPKIQPDVAVVIAPALLKRKEVFGLQARTILDDLSRDDKKVVLLRFDYCNIVGESTMDPDLVAQDSPYLNWDLRQMVADIQASAAYLDRRFRPSARVLVSYSFAAIGARQVVREAKRPFDLWIAPFGCPDLQDMLRNYLAGLDLFPLYEAGTGPELIHIHGRPMKGENYCMRAVEDGLAYLDQGRADIEQITTPITWILGTYDHWVTRGRVKKLLEAPGEGLREVFECATGHVLKEGPQAIEVFKLVSESIAKHVFSTERPSVEPNLGAFSRQSAEEWARVKKLKLGDATHFWREHLFGVDEGDLGYDIILEHPDYVHFLKRQAELLDARDGDAIADFGCGTGNLLINLLDVVHPAQPSSITFADLVPEALDRTEEKLTRWYQDKALAPPETERRIVDLEISKLSAVRDFLEGRVYGIEGLVGRLDGLHRGSAERIAQAHGRKIHEILRGKSVTREALADLAPKLTNDDLGIVLDFSRAARFVQGRITPDDHAAGVDTPTDTIDLHFDQLDFGSSARDFGLPFPDESFDRLGCSLVLSYLRDPLVSLREIHRLLKPGGVVVASSILPNWDPSKLYAEEAALMHQHGSEVKLDALRAFANMLSRLIELEEDGRFKFFAPDEFRALAEEAGFSRVHLFESLGTPATAVILRAEKQLAN
jgi:ubiquinone/menaquinone biosynthesis C-methylase UbiE